MQKGFNLLQILTKLSLLIVESLKEVFWDVKRKCCPSHDDLVTGELVTVSHDLLYPCFLEGQVAAFKARARSLVIDVISVRM